MHVFYTVLRFLKYMQCNVITAVIIFFVIYNDTVDLLSPVNL